MPKIPQAENNAGISVGATPRISTPEMNLGAQKSSERSQSDVVRSIASAEDAIIRVRNFRQTTEAQNFSFERLADIKSRADQDIDFDSSKYETEIDKVGQEASKTITGQLTKEDFMAGFQRQATATKWGIKNLFRERELEASKAAIEYNRQQIVNNYPLMTTAEQMTAVKSFKDMLVGGVKTGIYNKATAQALDAKFQSDVQESVVNNHIIADPDTALKGLKEGKEGPYPGISAEFRAESEEKAKAYSKKYKTEAEVTRQKQIETNEDGIVARMVDPQKPMPSEGEIVTLMSNEAITPQFAKAVIENLRSAEKYKAKTNSSAFNKISDFILNPENKAEDIRLELIKENAKGNLSDEDFSALYTFNQQSNKKDKNLALPKGLNFWHTDYANNDPEIRAKMFKNYMQRINKGEDPALAVDAVIKEQILILHPQATTYPKEGKKVMDSAGIFKKIFPTGEILDEEDTGDAD